jgi:hypothetical protein
MITRVTVRFKAVNIKANPVRQTLPLNVQHDIDSREIVRIAKEVLTKKGMSRIEVLGITEHQKISV